MTTNRFWPIIFSFVIFSNTVFKEITSQGFHKKKKTTKKEIIIVLPIKKKKYIYIYIY